ncbi:MAG: hypothetical protein ACI30K_08260 [Muribaculaceae bacterium]
MHAAALIHRVIRSAAAVAPAALLMLLTLTAAVRAQARSNSNLRDSIETIIDATPRTIEGIYRMGGDGALFAIVPTPGHTHRYDLVIIESPDFSVEPGTKFGYAVAGGSKGVYDAKVYGRLRADRSNKSHTFALRVRDDGYLSFEEYRNTKRISLWRWIPYLFRVTVIEDNNRPHGLDGAIRVYPPAPGITPRIL